MAPPRAGMAGSVLSLGFLLLHRCPRLWLLIRGLDLRDEGDPDPDPRPQEIPKCSSHPTCLTTPNPTSPPALPLQPTHFPERVVSNSPKREWKQVCLHSNLGEMQRQKSETYVSEYLHAGLGVPFFPWSPREPRRTYIIATSTHQQQSLGCDRDGAGSCVSCCRHTGTPQAPTLRQGPTRSGDSNCPTLAGSSVWKD